MTATRESQDEIYKYWRRRTLMSVWASYAMFYIGRVNMSIAIPGIMEEYDYTKTALGVVLTAFFATYAFGQFVNGQLGDKLGGRLMVTTGLILSAIFNFAFGFSSALTAMALIWALNGYVQSMGWSPSVKTIANWFPRRLRGRIGGIMGSSYQIGNALSWLLAGTIAAHLAWQWIFWIPAAVLLAAGLFAYLRLRNAPETVGLPTLEEEEHGREGGEASQDHHLGFGYTLRTVLSSRAVWIVGFGLFFLNIVRYGFMDWAPTYMFEEGHATISNTAYRVMVMPLAGSLGAICVGWLSDKVFHERRAPASAIMLFGLGLFAWLFYEIGTEHWIWSLVLLGIIGFLIYGPHVSMVAICPMDFASRKAAASAAGFIDGMGYIGAAITSVTSGYLADHLGWYASFYLWVGSAVAAACLMLLLWNHKPICGEYH